MNKKILITGISVAFVTALSIFIINHIRGFLMSKKSHARFEVSQGAVIQNEKGQVLLLKLHNNGWVLPGGHLEEKEAWLDGLRREIREETGITNFIVKGFLGVFILGTGYGVCFHAMVPSSPTIILSEEHDAYVWVSSKEEISQYKFYHPALRDFALKVLENKN